jgi:hypothetical protein
VGATQKGVANCTVITGQFRPYSSRGWSRTVRAELSGFFFGAKCPFASLPCVRGRAISPQNREFFGLADGQTAKNASGVEPVLMNCPRRTVHHFPRCFVPVHFAFLKPPQAGQFSANCPGDVMAKDTTHARRHARRRWVLRTSFLVPNCSAGWTRETLSRSSSASLPTTAYGCRASR